MANLKFIKDQVSNCDDILSDVWKGDKRLPKLSKDQFRHVRDSELQYRFYRPEAAVQQLFVDGMDSEQIWEQMVINDEELIESEKALISGSFWNGVSDIKLFSDAALQISTDTPIVNKKKQKKGGKDITASANSENDSDLADRSNDEDDSDIDSDLGGMSAEESDTDGEGQDKDTSSSNLDEGVAGSESEEQSCDNEEDDRDGDHEEEATFNKGDGGYQNDEFTKDCDSDVSAESEDSAYDELDKQLFAKYKKNDNKSDDESEIEDLAIGSDEESDSEDVNKEDDHEQIDDEDEGEDLPTKKKFKFEKSSNRNPLKNVVVPQFSKTSIDSDFFNVRESEWIADQDIIGGSNFDDVDFMEDIDDSAEKARYADFFDEAPNKKSKKSKKSSEDWGALEEDNKEEKCKEEATFDDTDVADKRVQFADPGGTELDGKGSEAATQQGMSRLEEELQREGRLRAQLEESNIGDKNWTMKGEVRAADRPSNSALTEYLEYRSGARIRPEIDDALNRRLEKLATSRIRTKTFDSVERKAKLIENPFEYKKKIVLDQEKSQKSLSKIYEEEYLKKQRLDSVRVEKKELKEHKEIRKQIDDLFWNLNRLTHCHYTPNMKQSEVVIVSNKPTLNMEEATPDVMTDADRLAPQEILETTRGALKGESEKTSTDKKRERRQKKHHQSIKYKDINKRLDAKIKKAGKDGKRLDIATSAKVVKKAIKVGHVKLLDNNAASVKSSTSFFKQLQEKHSSQTSVQANKRKRDQAS
uniref:U3 small nucleolar ribonucleoprotein protein MPP10-like n=2 Tax=Hirondellea gigas TaxID=1518452 RepID=A0A2P2I0Z6_9CRUS